MEETGLQLVAHGDVVIFRHGIFCENRLLIYGSD